MSKIDRVENRIRQIERRIEQGPQINSAAFNKLMAGHMDDKSSKASFGTKNAAETKLNTMGFFDLHNMKGLNSGNYSSLGVDVKPIAQSNSISCGQTSVAMCLNAIGGTNLTDMDINNKYGFQLLEALKNESRSAGVDWRDAGNITNDTWATIDRKVNDEKLPVIVALNGPEFSVSGRGHIVTIMKTTADTVTYADPADGQIKTTAKSNMTNAPSHPDGNFVFVADRLAPEPTNTEPYASNDPPLNNGTV